MTGAMTVGRPRKRTKPPAPDRIVDCALALAKKSGWAELRLHRVAGTLGISLNQLHAHFRDQNAIADAWFLRAHRAMLAETEKPGFSRRAPIARMEILLTTWFDALAPHRRVTAQMIAVKFHPPHAHHWVPAVFHLSRLMQWMHDAAGVDATGARRAAGEIALTGVFLAALAVWSRDDSPNQDATRRFVARSLAAGARIIAP